MASAAEAAKPRASTPLQAPKNKDFWSGWHEMAPHQLPTSLPVPAPLLQHGAEPEQARSKGIEDRVPQQQDTFSSLGGLYATLWRAVIRPPRSVYTMSQLGPRRFKLPPRSSSQAANRGVPLCATGAGGIFERRDLQLVNGRGHLLQCSHFLPQPLGGCDEKLPCVVYLHGSSSSRLDVFSVLPHVLSCGLTLFCLDFAGSGMSDGEYVSLGYFEQHDLRVVLAYLRSQGSVTRIAVWGRSMGAVTALLHASTDHGIAACVFESPFADFHGLIMDQFATHLPLVPCWLVDRVLSAICSEVHERAGFDPRWLRPVQQAPAGCCPALFCAAEGDKLVPSGHVKSLEDAWGGESHLVTFEGGHCDQRPEAYLWLVVEFLSRILLSDGDVKETTRLPMREVPDDILGRADADKLNLAIEEHLRRTIGVQVVDKVSSAIDQYIARRTASGVLTDAVRSDLEEVDRKAGV